MIDARRPQPFVSLPVRSDTSGDLRTAVPRRRADGRRTDQARRGLAAGGLEASRRVERGRAGQGSPRRSRDALQRTAQRVGAADRLDQPDGGLLAKPVRPTGRPVEKDGPMNVAATETRSVTVEREFPFPPEKLWRALTQPQLIAEWLMQNGFQPVVGHRFYLRGDWGAVDCKVLELEAMRSLSYTWDAMGLTSVVTWTLTASGKGTHLRMEQAGFRHAQEQAFQGAQYGWQRFFGSLEQVLARAE